MKIVNIWISGIIWLLWLVFLGRTSEDISTFIIMAVMMMGVHIVNTCGVYTAVKSGTQKLLTIAMCLYLFWFVFLYITTTTGSNRDPLAPATLFFAGLYSLPVMIPLWLVMYKMDRK